MIQFDEHMFQMCWNHQLEEYLCLKAFLPLQDAVEKFHAALEEGDEAEVWSVC